MIEIRNFSIIAHIDHGKSTLADRLLELTGTIPKREMRAQVLDMMELERERGITIKMQPVQMHYFIAGVEFEFNLIDTPGHIDFSYEVSRALKAVEGAVLLVDATKGVQAQTLSVLSLAKEEGLTIIPAINKIDLPVAKVSVAEEEIRELLGDVPILHLSAKSGAGVDLLLPAVARSVPGPEKSVGAGTRGLIFDFEYSTHRGLIVYLRLFDGEVRPGDELIFASTGETIAVLEVGIFAPAKSLRDSLRAGEIGYLVTGIKGSRLATLAKVGETITSRNHPLPPISGFKLPVPVIWASIYPLSQDDFDVLRQALVRLQLTDASLSFEEESSASLGRGFRCGFLGLLHLEIITERLKREFNLQLIVAAPSVSYRVTNRRTGELQTVYSPQFMPEDNKLFAVEEPWVTAEVITPPEYLNSLLKVFRDHEAELQSTENLAGDRLSLKLEMPLRELMRSFFDRVKSVSSGFASFVYKLGNLRPAAVARLDILVADELVPALSRVVSIKKVENEAKVTVERLFNLLPKQLFVVKIQAQALGRIIASRTLSAMKKDVTGYLYGGDITRKRKLWEKQKRGKKRMKESGRVTIPPAVFVKMVGVDVAE